ncbi:MAG: S1C family serine protease [Candidatus Coproplasma sp.]
MKKKFFACALLALILSLTALSGCTLTPRGIASIEKTGSLGLVDYYTITYTDGTTSTYTVTNGKDGEDADKLTVDEVYEFYKQTDPDMTKEEFVEKFLNLQNGGTSQDNLTALSSLFRSGTKVYTVFNESSTSEYESSFTGSGVIYKIESDYTYILTNYHMVYDSKSITADKICTKAFVYMYGSEYAPVRTTSGQLVLADDDAFGLDCEYVGGSVECDVAILKVATSELAARYPYAKAIEINQSYEVGQTVYALGNPDGEGLSLTKGIVSVDMEVVTLDIAGEKNYYLLRTDADLDHGSSGGGLFNSDGELIGLCNSGSESVASINYAIPAATVLPCAEGILHYNGLDATDHNTYRMRLGVTVFENNCRYVYDSATKSGKIKADITVSEPEAGSANPIEGYAAYAMGLQAGDIIRAITFNGTKHEINRMVDMTNVLMQVRAGDSVTITVERGDEEIESSAYAVAQTDLVSV